MTKLLLICLLLALSASTQSGASELRTGSVAGTVVDSTSNRPLGHTELVVLETGEKVTAKVDGTFAFENLPAGSYTIRAGCNDHWPRRVHVKVDGRVSSMLTVRLPVYRGVMELIIGGASVNLIIDAQRFAAKVAFVAGADGRIRMHIQHDRASKWLSFSQVSSSTELRKAIRGLRDGDTVEVEINDGEVVKLSARRRRPNMALHAASALEARR